MQSTTNLSLAEQAAIMKWVEQRGIGVIRAQPKIKEVHTLGWQTMDLRTIDFGNRLATGEYDEGIAVRTGKTLVDGQYLIVLDFDGWDSIVAWFGNWDNVIALSKRTLVEWHNDTSSIHVFLFSPEPILTRQIFFANDSQLEVRCENKEGTGTLIYVSPSIHISGKPYEPLGIDTIETMQDIDILRIKSKIDRLPNDYMSDVDKSAYDAMLDQPDLVIGVHGGRHDATKFKVIRYYWKYSGDWLDLTDEQRFEGAWQWHLAHCKPARDRREFDQICNWVTRTMSQKRDALHAEARATRKEQQSQQQQKDKKSQQKTDEDKNRYEYIQKYSDDSLLAEAIIVDKKARFAVLRAGIGEITLEKEIPLNDEKKTVLRPLGPESYINKAYVFNPEKQFYEYVDRALGEDLDSLYSKVKTIWRKYIDADDNHISLCAADTIFTYYQDAIGMTHYLFFVGDNDSGKSNNLVVFNQIGYRNLMSVGISVANIYQFLGSRDEAAGTICEDEANNIEDDRDKMEIAKSGYTKGYPVIRITISAGGTRFQHKYTTYCFKAYSAEKTPDAVKAKGLLQRMIRLRCTPGVPAYDILEVVNHAGDEELGRLFNELVDMRNLLLCHRLIHSNDKIPNIQLNLKNREKQLFKPLLRLFQGTKTFDHLTKVLSGYVNERRQTKKRSPNAFLCKLVKDMVDDKKIITPTITLETGEIWSKVMARTDGITLPGHPYSIDTSEFGILSQKHVTETLEDILKARYFNVSGRRLIVFDRNNLESVRLPYTEQKVSISLESADSADSAHVGNGGGYAEQQDDRENVQDKAENNNNHKETTDNDKENEEVR